MAARTKHQLLLQGLQKGGRSLLQVRLGHLIQPSGKRSQLLLALVPTLLQQGRELTETARVQLHIGFRRQRRQGRGQPGHPLPAKTVRQLGHRTTVAVGALEMHGPLTEAGTHIRLLDHVPHRSAAHRRQLRRIPHKHQTAWGWERLQQGLRQGEIQHRHLIHHQQVQLQGSALMAAEAAVGPRLQPAMQGGAWNAIQMGANGIRQTAGGLSGRSRQADAQIRLAGHGAPQQLHHRAGLARSRSATDQHHRAMVQGQHSCPLLLIQGNRGIGQGQGLARCTGSRPHRPLQQLLHHGIHGQQPTPPADPTGLADQHGIGPLQPTAGLSHRLPFRIERQIQLTPLQGLDQIRHQPVQAITACLRGDPPPQHVLNGCGEGRTPAAAHHAAGPRSWSNSSTRLRGAGSTIRPGPGTSSGCRRPGMPRRNA